MNIHQLLAVNVSGKQIMAELVNARCGQGRLILTEKDIIVQLKGMGINNTKTLPRRVFTSLETRTGVPSLLGMGGSVHMIFHGQGGEHMEVKNVPPKDAQKISDILNA